MKLMILCFVALMVLCAKAHWEEEGVAGEVGRTCYKECEKEGSKCSKYIKCCCPLACWVNGICAAKISETISETGEIIITGAESLYDSCENSKGRVGDDCTSESDCCKPLNCNSRVCSADQSLLATIGSLMSGGK